MSEDRTLGCLCLDDKSVTKAVPSGRGLCVRGTLSPSHFFMELNVAVSRMLPVKLEYLGHV